MKRKDAPTPAAVAAAAAAAVAAAAPSHSSVKSEKKAKKMETPDQKAFIKCEVVPLGHALVIASIAINILEDTSIKNASAVHQK